MLTAMLGAVSAVVSPEVISPDTVKAIAADINKPPSGSSIEVTPIAAGIAIVQTAAAAVVAETVFCKCRNPPLADPLAMFSAVMRPAVFLTCTTAAAVAVMMVCDSVWLFVAASARGVVCIGLVLDAVAPRYCPILVKEVPP